MTFCNELYSLLSVTNLYQFVHYHVAFVISLFNTVTGTDDRVTISMDVTNRREYRTGIVTIKTELNNLMHAELVHKVIALFDKEEQDG